MTKNEQRRYEKLYKYCTTRHSKGQLYRDRLKELQRLTVKALRELYIKWQERRKYRQYKQ